MNRTPLLVLAGSAVALGLFVFARNAMAGDAPSSSDGLPTPGVIGKGKTATVVTNTDSLSLRSGPSTTSPAIASIPKGGVVLVTGSLGLNGFYPVIFEGVSGYAYGGYLREGGSIANASSPSSRDGGGDDSGSTSPSPGDPSVPPNSTVPSGPRLLSFPAQMKPGARYRASIALTGTDAAFASKSAVESKLREVGFSNVSASGGGASWSATGTWARGAESFDKPDEISQAWELG